MGDGRRLRYQLWRRLAHSGCRYRIGNDRLGRVVRLEADIAMSNRDGKTAQKAPTGREYWSRRLPGAYSWGRIAKWMTHRKERAAAKREESRARRNISVGNEGRK
jgi:hypothetical protein